MKKYLIIVFALVFLVSTSKTTFAQTATSSTTSGSDNTSCTVMNPCNTIVQNNSCPTTWMNNNLNDSYTRDVSGYEVQNVCDYLGQATNAQCEAEGAMENEGPHGVWCQKFINNNSLLLSIARIPGQIAPEMSVMSGISSSISSMMPSVSSTPPPAPPVSNNYANLGASTSANSMTNNTYTSANTSGTQTDLPPSGVSQCANLTRNLGYGSRDGGQSADVSTLQDFLNSKGYLTASPTGFFGRATLAAVKIFQSSQNITPTGYVGSYTRAAIARVDCGSTNSENSTIPTTSPSMINSSATVSSLSSSSAVLSTTSTTSVSSMSQSTVATSTALSTQ